MFPKSFSVNISSQNQTLQVQNPAYIITPSGNKYNNKAMDWTFDWSYDDSVTITNLMTTINQIIFIMVVFPKKGAGYY
jgi:hypothetical protein